MVHDILRARREGKLSQRFRVSDVRKFYPDETWTPYISNFLSKHRRGNSSGDTERFIKHGDGTWSLIGECHGDTRI